MKKLPINGDCGDGDYDTGYEIGFASPRFISTQWSFYEYCHDTPHGMGWFKADNVVLQAEPRALKESDVFGADGRWKEQFQALVWDALIASRWTPREGMEDGVKAGMMARFILPESWLFTPDGLKLTFGSYEGGCYACTPQPVTVKWEALKPLLAAGSVVP